MWRKLRGSARGRRGGSKEAELQTKVEKKENNIYKKNGNRFQLKTKCSSFYDLC